MFVQKMYNMINSFIILPLSSSLPVHILLQKDSNRSLIITFILKVWPEVLHLLLNLSVVQPAWTIYHSRGTLTLSLACCSDTFEAACRGSSAGGRAPGLRPRRSRHRLLPVTVPEEHRVVRGEANPGTSGATLIRPGLRELQKLQGISTNHVCIRSLPHFTEGTTFFHYSRAIMYLSCKSNINLLHVTSCPMLARCVLFFPRAEFHRVN